MTYYGDIINIELWDIIKMNMSRTKATEINYWERSRTDKVKTENVTLPKHVAMRNQRILHATDDECTKITFTSYAKRQMAYSGLDWGTAKKERPKRS